MPFCGKDDNDAGIDPLTDNNYDWRKVVYKAQIDTLIHAKDTRWKIAYYILLLYAAIYALNNGNLLCNSLLLISIIALCISGLYFFYKIQRDICLARKVIEYAQPKNLFFIGLNDVINKHKEKCFSLKIKEKRFKEDIGYLIIQSIIIIVGAIILIYCVFNN